MSNNPLVSILIPVYNRKELLPEALQSALAQSYSDIEIVVSDNCSNDGTWEYLNAIRDPRVIVVRTAENIGPVGNWKHCFTHCRGKYIKVLFSDDRLDSDCVTRMVAPLLADNKCALSVGSVITFDEASEEVFADLSYQYRKQPCLEGFEAAIQFALFKLPVSPGALLVRRSAFEITTEYPNQNLRSLAAKGIGPDLLIPLHACTLGYCAVVPFFLHRFRRHTKSISIENSTILQQGYWAFFSYFVAASDWSLPKKATARMLTLTLKIKRRKELIKEFIKKFVTSR